MSALVANLKWLNHYVQIQRVPWVVKQTLKELAIGILVKENVMN
jgi:hypothetical protein